VLQWHAEKYPGSNGNYAIVVFLYSFTSSSISDGASAVGYMSVRYGRSIESQSQCVIDDEFVDWLLYNDPKKSSNWQRHWLGIVYHLARNMRDRILLCAICHSEDTRVDAGRDDSVVRIVEQVCGEARNRSRSIVRV
jgi:hypothetical protein